MTKKTEIFFSQIPMNMVHDKNLKSGEKVLFAEISALFKMNGSCWATNDYFAQLYKVHSCTISTWISHLRELGWIETQFIYKKGTKEIEKRIIRPIENPKGAHYTILLSCVLHDERLTANEKLILSEIATLSNKEGFCWATNEYFAKLYHVHPRTVSKWIRHLKELGYLEVQITYKEGTKEIDQRLIRQISQSVQTKEKVVFPLARVSTTNSTDLETHESMKTSVPCEKIYIKSIQENEEFCTLSAQTQKQREPKEVPPFVKTCIPPLEKSVEGIRKITKENNITINNKFKKSLKASKEASKEIFTDVQTEKEIFSSYPKHFIHQKTVELFSNFDFETGKDLLNIIFKTKKKVENFKNSALKKAGKFSEEKFFLEGDLWTEEVHNQALRFVLKMKTAQAKDQPINNVRAYWFKTMETFWQNVLIMTCFRGIIFLHEACSLKLEDYYSEWKKGQTSLSKQELSSLWYQEVYEKDWEALGQYSDSENKVTIVNWLESSSDTIDFGERKNQWFARKVEEIPAWLEEKSKSSTLSALKKEVTSEEVEQLRQELAEFSGFEKEQNLKTPETRIKESKNFPVKEVLFVESEKRKKQMFERFFVSGEQRHFIQESIVTCV